MSYLDISIRKQKLQQQMARLQAEIESLERQERAARFPDNWKIEGVLVLTGSSVQPILSIAMTGGVFNLGEIIREEFFQAPFGHEYVEAMSMEGYKMGRVLIAIKKLEE